MLLDLHERVRRYHSVFGERADLGDVAQVPAVGGVVAERAVGGHARDHGADTDVADVFGSGCTPTALAADRDERHHHVVARGEFRDALSDFAHDARTLVPADHGEHGGQPHRTHHLVGRRHVAFEDVVVGMAQPGGGHLHENLAGLRGIQLEFLDGPRAADVVQDRRAAFHDTGVKVTGRLFGRAERHPDDPGVVVGSSARFSTRSSRLFSITRVSSRAKCIPRHMWMPPANEMCAWRGRWMSNVLASVQRLSSRLAEPMHRSTCAFAGMVVPLDLDFLGSWSA